MTASAPGPSFAARDPRYSLNAQGCPHPERRRWALVQLVDQGEGAFEACVPCLTMFEEFKRRWLEREIAPAEVEARMRKAGYDGAAVREFLSGLEEAA